MFQKEKVPANYDVTEPEHRHIYRFIRTLFSSAQLTAECAIVTLVSKCTVSGIGPLLHFTILRIFYLK